MKTTIAVVTLFSIFATSYAKAYEVAVDITVASRHLCDCNLNEKNEGIGLKATDGRDIYVAGTFRNSFDEQAVYAGYGKELLFGNALQVKLGVAAGVVSGYQGTPGELKGFGAAQPFVLPYIEVGTKKQSARFGLLGNAITLQLSFKL